MKAASPALHESLLTYNQTMQIQLANPEDIPGIMEIVVAVIPLLRAAGNMQWDDRYPNPEVFEADIALSQLWVASIEGKIVGVVAITTEQYPEYVQAGWDITDPAIVIHRLAVNPEFQGKGIAAALLHKAEVVALSRGFCRVLSDTNSHNQVMQHLLPKLGYSFSGKISLEFRPGMHFLCYEKRLK